ncbi:MAG: Asp-tRNA(Asn)/Glu-tRNA(Gln) amidotransferase subunit GatA [Myxococcota bacterium]|nr:Asp-tRNA(Asn)/Glu-tRNA(Gln) amidotransferase subunit GatA [Myxococcota bacterium]
MVADPMPTLRELAASLEAGERSSLELVEQSLTRARECESLAAFLSLREDGAREEARAADRRRAAGERRSPLDGIPIAIKDNITKRGETAGCASRILEGYRSPFDATALARLEAAGCIVVGRTNMDEFAMGSSTENSAYGPSRNPWDPERAPGGSSGGSAVAVAAGVVPVALGSDTGGSIRQPASFTGIVGMKPTYGRVSRLGLVAFASSLDQIGPFARTARDCAWVLDAMSGNDPGDSTSLPDPPTRSTDALTDALEMGDLDGLRIGLPSEYFELEGAAPGVIERVREAVAELEAAGARTVPVSLPNSRFAVACYYLVATAEASSNLARFDGARYGRRAAGAADVGEMIERSRSEGFGAEVKRRILLGTFVLSAGYYDAYYKKAQQVRTLLRDDFGRAFEECDVIAAPTSPETAFRFGEKADPLALYLSDVYTVSANLTGTPAVSVPCGLSEGLPVGLQLIGPARGDETILRVADAYQQRTSHHEARPPLAGAGA